MSIKFKPTAPRSNKVPPCHQHEPIRIDKHGLFKFKQKAYRVPKAVWDSAGYTLTWDMITKEPVKVTDSTGNKYEFERLGK